MSVEQTHEEKETLSIDVELPGHAPRTETSLFERTKKELHARENGRCFLCGQTEVETGMPHEAHHHPVERSLATAWDWPRFIRDCQAGAWGPHAQSFDWASFDPVSDPYKFVDDMTANGLLLCKHEHTGADAGIHSIPFPLWIWRRYAPQGYAMTPTEHLKHDFT